MRINIYAREYHNIQICPIFYQECIELLKLYDSFYHKYPQLYLELKLSNAMYKEECVAHSVDGQIAVNKQIIVTLSLP